MDLGRADAHIWRDEDRAMSRIADAVGFVHLRVHSAFSLLEGALPLKTLAKLATADRMPALGIADTGNLYDIIVTVMAVHDGDGAGTLLTNPQIDRETLTDPLPIPAYLGTPMWDLNNRVMSNLETWMTMKYQFVDHATGSPVSLNVIATSVDNDSTDNTHNTVQEYVRYNTLLNAWMYGTGSLLP